MNHDSQPVQLNDGSFLPDGHNWQYRWYEQDGSPAGHEWVCACGVRAVRRGVFNRRWEVVTAPAAPEPCHCGNPVAYGYDGDPTHHRGMCEDCDLVRCDAYPGACVTTPGQVTP